MADRTRKVVVRATVTYEIEVPQAWGKREIEFRRNDGTWCAGNMIKELQDLGAPHEGCICPNVRFEYVREGDQ